MISTREINRLELIANDLRMDCIKMLAKAGSGHTAGPLSMADVFAALYFKVLKHKPKKPDWSGRDLSILSNGHICPILYAALARAGYFPLRELGTLRKLGTRLQGHPHRGTLPGIETTSGPLGSGLSQAVGMALALRIDKKKNHIYCLMSDGEQDAGQTWEAALMASHYKLRNITGIVDRNFIQIGGSTTQVMSLEPFKEKYES